MATPSASWADDQVMVKVKRALIDARGPDAFCSAVETFSTFTLDSEGRLSEASFRRGLKDHHIILSDFEFSYLVAAFEKGEPDGRNRITLRNFVVELVHSALNVRRQTAIDKAYDELAMRAGGVLTAEYVRSMFDPHDHPAVLTKRVKAERVKRDFDIAFASRPGEAEVDRELFKAFFSGISALVPSDDIFESIVLRCFNLDDPRAPELDVTERDWTATRTQRDPLEHEPVHPADPWSRTLYTKGPHRGYDTSVTARPHMMRHPPVAPHVTVDYVSTTHAAYPDPRDAAVAGTALAGTALSTVSAARGGLFASVGANAGPAPQPESPTGYAMGDAVRARLLARCGAAGVVAVQRALQQLGAASMDAAVTANDIAAASEALGVTLSSGEARVLLTSAAGGSVHAASVSVRAVLRTLRGPVASARTSVLQTAFDKLDAAGRDAVTVDQVVAAADHQHHPDVAVGPSGRGVATAAAAAGSMASDLGFIASGAIGTAPAVTRAEFVEYLLNQSPAYATDAAFELLVRDLFGLVAPRTAAGLAGSARSFGGSSGVGSPSKSLMAKSRSPLGSLTASERGTAHMRSNLPTL